MSTYPGHQALKEFRQDYGNDPRVRRVDSASYERTPGKTVDAIAVFVEPGFPSDELPAAFRGYDVLLTDDDGHSKVATGPLI